MSPHNTLLPRNAVTADSVVLQRSNDDCQEANLPKRVSRIYVIPIKVL